MRHWSVTRELYYQLLITYIHGVTVTHFPNEPFSYAENAYWIDHECKYFLFIIA